MSAVCSPGSTRNKTHKKKAQEVKTRRKNSTKKTEKMHKKEPESLQKRETANKMNNSGKKRACGISSPECIRRAKTCRAIRNTNGNFVKSFAKEPPRLCALIKFQRCPFSVRKRILPTEFKFK